LDALRRNRPGAQGPERSDQLWDEQGRRLSFSRRSLFGLAGFTSLGLSSALAALETSALGSLEVVAGRRRVSFKLDGSERWVIDTRRFSGSPQLSLQRQEQLIRVELRNARLPGTYLPADLSCVLRPALVGWRMNLDMTLGGFSGTVSCERWLAGIDPVRGSLQAHQSLGSVAPDLELALANGALAEFYPNWDLLLSGDRASVLQGQGLSLTSDRIELSLLEPGTKSVVHQPPTRRTLISVQRGAGAWSLDSLLPAPSGARFATDSGSFDLLHIEVGEDRRGTRHCTLVAESSDREPALSLEPSAGLQGDDETPFQLPLGQARIAAVLAGGLPERVILARYVAAPAVLQAEGCALYLGGSPEAPPFELLAVGDRVERLCCEPTLHAVSAPMPDAIAGPLYPPYGTRIVFSGHGWDDAGQQKPVVKKPPKVRVRKPEEEKKQTRPVAQQEPARVLIDQSQIGRVLMPVNLRVAVIRPADLLHFELELVNLRLATDGGAARMTPRKAGSPSYLIVHLQPQHITEKAYFESEVPATSEQPEPPPVAARLSGPSRLVFSVPSNQPEIPYTLEAVLDACSSLPLKVPRTALPPDPPPSRIIGPVGIMHQLRRRARPIRPLRQRGLAVRSDRATMVAAQPAASTTLHPVRPDIDLMLPPPSEPGPLETAIEAPYRLFLSPHRKSAWAHAVAPVPGVTGRYELWHTRLAVRADDGSVDEENRHYRTLRAVWSPDYNPDDPPDHYPYEPESPPYQKGDPYRMSLDARDRHEIVPLSSDWTNPAGAKPSYKPLPIRAERFMLSTLGAWIDSRGVWDPEPAGLAVEEWRHRASMARDHYVRVVTRGYLFPFRHRASLVKVTERKLRPVPDGPLKGKLAAYLFQRQYIVVREPEITYSYAWLGTEGQKLDRQNPFKTVRITTLVTPKLDPADLNDNDIDNKGQQVFWPHVAQKPFLFHLIGEDWRGERSELTTPLIFVETTYAQSKALLDLVVADFDAKGGARDMQGQGVAFAEESEDKPGDTTLDTQSITFGGKIPSKSQGYEPRFYPTMTEAEVRIPAVEAITGGEPSRINISQIYIDNSYAAGPNSGQVFAELVDVSPLRFPADRSGGLVTPDMDISCLSRKSGPVGGNPASIANDSFDPEEFFGTAGAMILGGLELFKILDPGGTSDNAPKLTNTMIYPGGDQSKLPEGVRTDISWSPTLTSHPLFTPRGTLSIDGYLVTWLDGKEPEYSITGELTDFDINLIGTTETFLILSFNKLYFNTSSGTKMSFDPDIKDITFDGALAFIQELREFLKGAGFHLDVSGDGVTVGYTLAIPTVTVGVMQVQNISLTAAVTIPFSGDALRLYFAFCERENPFLLTVYCFGGGGFVGLTLGLDGVELLEVSLEFGASASLDIGVASGGVEVMAGIYMKVESENCALTGYVRMGGELSVLGIITLSLEFYMSLTYESNGNKVWGEARLTVEIEILFFSVSVTMSVRREFADPEYQKFAVMMAQSDWDQYCEAFA
jgi:hypothetical protein